tara:strand:+ start:768 stop:1226 length:459 start_codon:yes stop_codon:yes gene_type:complete
MGLDKNKQLKFDVGTTDPLTVESAGMVESDFGSDYVVMITPTIDGYTHFKPSPGLQKKIKEENVDVGDVITIEKAPVSDKYPYGYFNVNVVSKVGKKTNVVKETAKQYEKQHNNSSDKLELHELKMRMETIEGELHLLKKKVEENNKPVAPF